MSFSLEQATNYENLKIKDKAASEQGTNQRIWF